MIGMKLSTSISEVDIQKRVKEIGTALTEKFKNSKEPVVAICILKGSFIFYSDLIRSLDLDVTCEFLGVSSYHNSTQSSGEVKVTLDLSAPIEGKNVVVVEDIVDTGLTMQYLKQYLESRKPLSLTTVTLLHKPDATVVKTKLDHIGFEIGNDFVVGYGLDYQGYYRHLPYIAQIQNLN
jgi:hypoxanthine phosphoribosyltransferase